MIPKSEARNSYELMEEVKELVLEDPKKCYMGTWLTVAPDSVSDIQNKVTTGPRCGTIGCIAGWMVALTAESIRPFATTTAYGIALRSVMDEAVRLLPRSVQADAENLFLGESSDHGSWDDDDYEPEVDYSFPGSPYGTPEYAEEVAANITLFMERHEGELKAFPLPKKEQK